MARIEKADRGLNGKLDEVEQKMFVLKIDYEKYFSGLERIEPLRDRDELRRQMRDFLDEPIRNSVQRFRYQALKARFQSLELYWQRNLVLIERGTHPKMRFRADAKARTPTPEIPTLSAEQVQVLEQRQQAQEREERAYKLVYDRYIEARAKCGQGTDLSFDAVRDALRKQVRQIKSTYQCEGVKFRVVVEDGKAKVKALPQGGAGQA
ncbi:MAG: MXAN_5187 C-terminal domain-containing protein [Pseudomonadota bacterium]|nr:MXAN_5187 C-terminal domain-containing protein [Pseudomonadota bacterium]